MPSGKRVTFSTNNQGANGYVASLSTGFSLKAVELAMGGCWFGREHVDLLVSDQNSWNWFFNKLQPAQRFNEESSDVAKSGFVKRSPLNVFASTFHD